MVCETIEVFRDYSLYVQLLDKCEVNTLLRHRTESIHLLLTDIRFARDKVENHYNKIMWCKVE